MECKFIDLFNIPVAPTVLILTYWNVNITRLVTDEYNTSVLILTYWNVNQFNGVVNGTAWSINLNLLECKSAYGEEHTFGHPWVLILTYWNVNKSFMIAIRVLAVRINLNLLECKS